MRLRQRFKIWIVVTALGPAVGAMALVTIPSALSFLGSQSGDFGPLSILGAWLFLVAFAVAFAYPLAGLPAALTGLLMALLAGRVSSRWAWALIAAGAGAALAALLAGLPSFRDELGWGWRAAMGATGGFAGLITGLISWPLARPGSTTTDQPASTRASPD